MKTLSKLAGWLLALVLLAMGVPALLVGLAIAWAWWITSPDTGD